MKRWAIYKGTTAAIVEAGTKGENCPQELRETRSQSRILSPSKTGLKSKGRKCESRSAAHVLKEMLKDALKEKHKRKMRRQSRRKQRDERSKDEPKLW